MEYNQRLEQFKKFNVINKWRSLIDEGLPQFSKENCDTCQKIINTLVKSLIDLGEYANEKYKVQEIGTAVKQFNELNSTLGGDFIGSSERDDLVEMFDQVAGICGIDTMDYGDGTGIANEWLD
jgi:endogenous inhibitor of DNA gyrase (YacG/DUF329 family)